MLSVHLDAVGGIAGDMFVAAMLDAFPDLKERVLSDGRAVLPPEAGGIQLTEGKSGDVRALRFGLTSKEAPAHRHEHASAEHAQDHHHDHGHPHEHHHHEKYDRGSFRDMVARIEAANLHQGTATHAVAILTILAKAEAAIHDVPLDHVHFHEIGDWDSLLDVTCAGSIAAALAGATWTVSPLPRGGGLVKTAHGLLPVPAPATAAILEGFEWRDDGISGERVTPTGAAILRHLVAPGPARADGPNMGQLKRSGTGAGTRQLPGMPNILRALAFETSEQIGTDFVTVIEFDVDDMTGEEVGVAVDRLRLVEGVIDVSIGQRFGKKGRPTQSFRLLARPEMSHEIIRRCFSETSTIGLRHRTEQRTVLTREQFTVAGIPVKAVSRHHGKTVKAESDALNAESLTERRALKHRAETGND